MGSLSPDRGSRHDYPGILLIVGSAGLLLIVGRLLIVGILLIYSCYNRLLIYSCYYYINSRQVISLFMLLVVGSAGLFVSTHWSRASKS